MLLISTCAEALHELEFVTPVERIVRGAGHVTTVRHVTAVSADDLASAEGIVICGTSLKDNDFLHTDCSWLTTITVPVLGICAGMHLIGLAHGGTLNNAVEIGLQTVSFTDFLGLNGPTDVFSLHTSYIDFTKLNSFRVHTTGGVPQAVAHRHRPLYGVLFHPEVRRHELLTAFCARVQKQ